MRRLPLPLKLGLSTAVSGSMCYLLYLDHLYEEDLYRVALKYRQEYDQNYNDYLETTKIERGPFMGSAAEERPQA